MFRSCGVTWAIKQISVGDEDCLLDLERNTFSTASIEVKRRSGAARSLARSLLKKHAYGNWPFPRSYGNAPRWPDGIVGSMAHSIRFAVAAIAPANRNIRGIGIDIVPAEPLPNDVEDAVLYELEKNICYGHRLNSRITFCAKEASFKALSSLYSVKFGFADIIVDLISKTAVPPGYLKPVVNFDYGIQNEIVVISIIK